MNVGATTETEAGLYFAWGETQGYADASTKAYNWNGYVLTDDSGSTMSKYTGVSGDGLTHLELSDDAASVNMGGDWHMPNKAQFNELLNTEYVTNTWVTDYQGSSINGRLFTSVSNGNTLFIPAAGYCANSEVYGVGNIYYVWTSALYSENVKNALCFYSYNSDAGRDLSLNRYYGNPVRGVVGN